MRTPYIDGADLNGGLHAGTIDPAWAEKHSRDASRRPQELTGAKYFHAHVVGEVNGGDDDADVEPLSEMSDNILRPQVNRNSAKSKKGRKCKCKTMKPRACQNPQPPSHPVRQHLSQPLQNWRELDVRYTNVCLIDAVRALGVKVPHTRHGPFFMLRDGNAML